MTKICKNVLPRQQNIVVNRFEDEVSRGSTWRRKVSASIGLDPLNILQGRRRIGEISKAGSRLLRFLLVEAGQMAIRQDQHLKNLYWRVQLRRNKQKAKVAVARQLLVRSFIMLRDQIDYEEFLRRGVAARSSRSSP